MKKINTLLTGLLFTGLVYTGWSQSQIINVSTGVDNTTANLIAPGSFDDTWTVLTPASSSFANVRCTDGTILLVGGSSVTSWSPISGARWISPVTTQNGPNHSAVSPAPQGNYVYRMEFGVMYYSCINNATLFFDNIGGDNNVTNVNVNGHNHSLPGAATFNPPATNVSFNVSSELTTGTNYIEITVSNSEAYTGFLAKGNLTINYNGFPTVTIPSFNTGSYCAGDPIWVDGSGTTITGGSFGSHVWTIRECDQYGNVNQSVAEWWSPWFTGAPGVYDFNGAPNIQCGKYYLIKLGLVNGCEAWKQVTHVVYVNCRPEVSLHGSTTEICPGETGYISPNVTYPSGLLNSTVQITEGIRIQNHTFYFLPMYTGPASSVGVSPVATTTYRIVVTDNNTGCTTTVYHTVYVKNTDPSFSLTANTANSAYMELTATPNVSSGLPAGFQYLWYIDELDVNGNTVYQVFDNTCWMNFPSVVNQFFEGVDATQSGYSGTVVCGWPTKGKFKYNTNYRVTRVTWATGCNPTQSSLLISAAKSVAGVVISEDHNAPDYTKWAASMALEKNDPDKLSVKVFPNPSDGIFVLETENITTGSAVIVDALGKQVRSVVLNGSNRYNIDLSLMAKGIYTLRVVSGSRTFAEKIIIR